MSRNSAIEIFRCSGAPDCANIVIHECKKCKIKVHKYCNDCYKQPKYFCPGVFDESIHDEYPLIGNDSEPPAWEMGYKPSSKKNKSYYQSKLCGQKRNFDGRNSGLDENENRQVASTMIEDTMASKRTHVFNMGGVIG